MTDTPPPTVSRHQATFQRLARASWIAPLLAAALGIIVVLTQGEKAAPNKVQSIVSSALILIGLLSGIIALVGAAKVGRRGILLPATIGTALSLGFIAASLLPVLFQAKPTPLQPLVRANPGRVLIDTNAGFSVEIPPDFVGFPQAREMHRADYVFVKGDSNDKELDLLVSFTSLPGALKKQRMQARNLPAGQTNATLRSFSWRGLEVDGLVVNENLLGTPFTTFNIRIPSVPRALQVSVAGPTARQAELEQIAAVVLASLDAQSNW